MDKLSQGINGRLEKVGNELNCKLDNIARDIQRLSERVDKAESRITQQESWAEEVTTACARVWRSVNVFSKRLLMWNQGHGGGRNEPGSTIHNSWISF